MLGALLVNMTATMSCALCVGWPQGPGSRHCGVDRQTALLAPQANLQAEVGFVGFL